MLRRTTAAAFAAAALTAAALQPAFAQFDTDALADAVEARVIEWRRHIHRHPELSYQEVETAAYVASALRAMPGLEVRTGIAKTGVKAVLRGGRPGPVVALRADMDALPVEEQNSPPFRSQSKALWQGKETGVMHACGHDAHVAMLLGAAEVLSKIRTDLAGTVVFLFQPAEEWGGQATPSGATAMVAEGAMDDPKVDAVLGQHISAGHPAGSILYRRGATMAAVDTFEITVRGAGGHAAMPWLSKDPIVTAAQIVTNLQSVVSRQVNLSEGAAVVTVGQFNAGNRPNVIPETATIAGTIRTLSEATRRQIRAAVTRMARNVAEASGLTAEVTVSGGYPALYNDPQLGSRLLAALERASGQAGVREIPPVLASEDFGAFTAKAPGFYWFLNASPHPDRSGAPNHSPLFTIDERHLKTGVKALVDATLAYLASAGPR